MHEDMMPCLPPFWLLVMTFVMIRKGGVCAFETSRLSARRCVPCRLLFNEVECASYMSVSVAWSLTCISCCVNLYVVLRTFILVVNVYVVLRTYNQRRFLGECLTEGKRCLHSICVYVHACMCYVHVYVYRKCMYVCMYVCMCLCKCMCMCMCMRIYVLMIVHVHMHVLCAWHVCMCMRIVCACA